MNAAAQRSEAMSKQVVMVIGPVEKKYCEFALAAWAISTAANQIGRRVLGMPFLRTKQLAGQIGTSVTRDSIAVALHDSGALIGEEFTWWPQKV